MKNIYNIFYTKNSKGGVGKSAALAAVTYLLQCTGAAPVIVDTDPPNPDMQKAHASTLRTYCVALDREDGYTTLAKICGAHDDPVMVSGAAGNQDVFLEYAPVLDLACQSIGRAIAVIWPLDLDIDSFVSLADSAEAMPNATFWVVRNCHFGGPDQFRAWNNSETARPYFQTGQILDLPAIPASVMRLFKTGRKSFAEIETHGEFQVRAALEIWRGRASRALAPLLG